MCSTPATRQCYKVCQQDSLPMPRIMIFMHVSAGKYLRRIGDESASSWMALLCFAPSSVFQSPPSLQRKAFCPKRQVMRAYKKYIYRCNVQSQSDFFPDGHRVPATLPEVEAVRSMPVPEGNKEPSSAVATYSFNNDG